MALQFLPNFPRPQGRYSLAIAIRNPHFHRRDPAIVEGVVGNEHQLTVNHPLRVDRLVKRTLVRRRCQTPRAMPQRLDSAEQAGTPFASKISAVEVQRPVEHRRITRLVDPLDAIEQRPARDGDLPYVIIHQGICDDHPRRHVELQHDPILRIPGATNYEIAIFNGRRCDPRAGQFQLNARRPGWLAQMQRELPGRGWRDRQLNRSIPRMPRRLRDLDRRSIFQMPVQRVVIVKVHPQTVAGRAVEVARQ